MMIWIVAVVVVVVVVAIVVVATMTLLTQGIAMKVKAAVSSSLSYSK
jgi:cell division protein FtsL